MAALLVLSRLPLDATTREVLKNLVDSKGFQVLKEVVASRAAASAVESANWLAGEGEEPAAGHAATAAKEAACLSILEDIQKNLEKCFTALIEPRR